MSTSQRVIKNTLYLYMRTVVSLLASVFTTRILLDALGTSDYGLYNVVGGAIAMLGFLTASMSSATQRFLSYAEGAGDKDKTVKYFNNSIIIHYGLALIMLLVFIVAALFFFNGILNVPADRRFVAVVVYICMLISTAFSVTVVPYDAEINAHENMLFYSLLGILDVLFKLAIAVAVCFFDSDKLVFYAVLMAVESFVLRFISQQYCRRRYEECRQVNLRKHYDKAVIKEMTSFAGWNLTNIATGMISLYGMNIVINHYFGTSVNAAMGIATQLSGAMMSVSANMIKAVTPIIVKAESGKQHNKMINITYVSCKFSYLLFLYMCIPFLFFMPQILSLWLVETPKWTEEFCTLLIITTLLEQMTVTIYQSILAVGNIRKYNIVRSINNSIVLPISIFAFHFFDMPPYWVLIIWLIFRAVIGGSINVYYAKKNVRLSISIFTSKVMQPAFLATIASAILGLFCSFCGIVLKTHWLFNLILIFALSIPIIWFIAISNREKSIFISSFSKMFMSTKRIFLF